MSDNALEQWRIEKRQRLQEEQRQRDAAQAAAAANDPVAIYAATANAEAEHNRQLVLSGVLSDDYLSQFGTDREDSRSPKRRFKSPWISSWLKRLTTFARIRMRKCSSSLIWRNNISPAAC